ncbi:helix-turn-helix domain-containing protein [Shimia sagamensis]|uniref:Cro/C1-type HTH DNA-binding domain-containing protein n=1 Tax=Shimia sagamensis TaxID=1566352 RepID=A0ABY1P291_9RHOB|nr:helix-turn-helix transcriptional regulator [Shimia sagamensis]SMP23685.1 Cro/C1-type HTH DNA-binding domain-containing protein [Shimia sagamensis]
MQAELFEVLKSVLKARGMTYAELASALGLSEPTVKRVFSERDCKLSRITEICNVLGLTLDDLVTEANRVEVRPIHLGDRLEIQLSEDPHAFHLFLLLLDGMSSETICEQYQLEEIELFSLGRRLEKLGLAEVMPNTVIRLTVQAPVHFRRDGPLHQKLLQLNMDFLRASFLRKDTAHSTFSTQTRRISQKTARHIVQRVRELQLELATLARTDQLTHSQADLDTYKIGVGFSPINFADMLSLGQSKV